MAGTTSLFQISREKVTAHRETQQLTQAIGERLKVCNCLQIYTDNAGWRTPTAHPKHFRGRLTPVGRTPPAYPRSLGRGQKYTTFKKSAGITLVQRTLAVYPRQHWRASIQSVNFQQIYKDNDQLANNSSLSQASGEAKRVHLSANL